MSPHLATWAIVPTPMPVNTGAMPIGLPAQQVVPIPTVPIIRIKVIITMHTAVRQIIAEGANVPMPRQVNTIPLLLNQAAATGT